MNVAFLLSFLLIGRTIWASAIDPHPIGADRFYYGRLQPKPICDTPGCNKAAQFVSEYMYQTPHPCDNFYEFVCNRVTQFPIPEGGNSVANIGKTLERIQQQLKEAIEGNINENDCEALKKLQSYYNCCQLIERNEGDILQALNNILDRLGGWPVLVGEDWDESTFDWKNVVYQLRELGYVTAMNSFISFGIGVDELDTTKYVLTLDAANTGLNQEYLIQGRGITEVLDYYGFMTNAAQILGADIRYAELELAESLDFEIALAKISSPNEDDANQPEVHNHMTINELESKYPEIPWREYVSTLLRPYHTIGASDKFIVMNPNYFQSFIELISRTSKRTLANYLIWRVVQESVPLMSGDFLNMVGTQLPRDQQCLNYVKDNIPLAVGALYVRKVFDRNLKNEVTKLVNELTKSFKKSLETADWMDRTTRNSAIKKLESIHAHVAYPDELLDDRKLNEYFENLKFNPDNYLDAHLSLNLLYLNDLYRKFRLPHDKRDWTTHGSSAVVNAFYKPTENSIEIPAGYIQEELFAIDRPNYINYAALGSVIGHELTHAFDNEGSKYNEHGNLANWWDNQTLTEYNKRAECIVNQYNGYTALDINVNINGENTLGENMADIGGIKQAYLAYEEYEKQNGAEQELPGLLFTTRQLFWISAAKIYCEKQTPADRWNVVTNDAHCPGDFRVTGSFSNMPEFARDFRCPGGSLMNPSIRCTFL